ncbi:hypothetical protein KQ51_00149 [Candidatus Izimaplasma bacterium HR1]|jgi:hypothetical protein|uniref:hypothetical protein n=1 Tax=Candidatus Izimoplasma sp. HR1 TaxID=1541959 RepID=UPI0004F58B63|nr:hypothetical protein KQ51_00149 [Candidatus Izimaplasma bacterium HR1]
MKKVMLVLILVITVTLLTACNRAEPLEEPEVDLFEEIYEGDDFSIWERIYKDPDMLFEMPGYYVGDNNDTCSIGEPQRYYYMIEHYGEYYDILEANKLRVYTCDDLTTAGVIVGTEE